jgi:hypothetical protein
MISLEERKARVRARRAAEGEKSRDDAENFRAELAVQAEDSMAAFAAGIARTHGSMVGTVRNRADLGSLAGTLERAQASAAPRAAAPRALDKQAEEDSALIHRHPALAAILARIPAEYIAAMRTELARGFRAETAKTRLDMPALRDLAARGDATAAAILEVREESLLMGRWMNPKVQRMARAVGITKEDWRKYAPVE